MLDRALPFTQLSADAWGLGRSAGSGPSAFVGLLRSFDPITMTETYSQAKKRQLKRMGGLEPTPLSDL